jgi:two-component system CheB/CheR fusion protein
MADIFRLRDLDRGRPIADIVTGLSYDDLANDVRTVLRELSMIEKEVRLNDLRMTFLMRIRPYRTLDNLIDGVVVTFVDITDRRQAEDQRNLLLQELKHRVKNALATVQSIAAQTFQHTATREEFQSIFLARLMSLARTHDLLTQRNWAAASLRDLLLLELEPYRGSMSAARFAIDGPDIQLAPRISLPLGLAFHELTTNAAKFGALSSLTGRIDIEWKIDVGEHRLRLRWTETGGPRVENPSQRGLGFRVIETGLMHELGGEARINFDPSGVECSIDIPLPPEGSDA